MMAEKTDATRFWLRPDIIGAQRAMDVWGTLHRHRSLGGDGMPLLDWIDGLDERFVVLEERGRIEAARNRNFVPEGKLTHARLITLGVDAVIGEFESPPVLRMLLFHRYPQDGPLARTEHERSYRRFRPSGLYTLLCGTLRGKWVERKIDELLGSLEREFLEHLAFCGVRR